MQSSTLLNQEKKFVQPSRSLVATGRRVGVLLLLQLAAALTLPFILSKPITLGSPAFLSAVTEHSFQVRSAVLLSFIGSALTVYLGVVAFPVFQRYSRSAALLFLVSCAISCTLDVVQAASVMSMLSISNSFVASGTTASELYQVVGAAVALARRSAHATQLLGIGAWIFIFYSSLFRFKLMPLVLAVLGAMGIVLQFIGVTLMMFLGYRAVGEMAMPLLPIQITVAVWLMVKGFNDPALKAPTFSDTE